LRTAAKPGRIFWSALRELADMPLVGDVRGLGLFCGVEFVSDKPARTPISEADMNRLMALMVAEGVLAGRTNSSLPGNNTIMNFAPALVATRSDIDEIVAALKAALEKF
jgi:taurine-pyruvate aminotransferase